MAATIRVRNPLGSCRGDMAVHMPDRGLVFERATCLYCSKRVTSLVDCVICLSIPMIKTGWPTPYGWLKIAWPTPYQGFKNWWPTLCLLRPTLPPPTFWPVPESKRTWEGVSIFSFLNLIFNRTVTFSLLRFISVIGKRESTPSRFLWLSFGSCAFRFCKSRSRIIKATLV